MTEQQDNIVLHMLRQIRGDTSELKADMGEVKQRLGTLEEQGASISRRIDRVGGDAERIKRRLDMVEA